MRRNAIVAIALFFVAALAARAEELIMTFQVLPNAKQATLDAIAALAEPKKKEIRERTTVQKLLRQEYGSSHEKLQAVFAGYNHGASNPDVLMPGTEVTLPAAPRWGRHEVVPVHKNVKALDQALMKMGVAGDITKDDLVTENKKPLRWLQSLKSGTIKLPYTAPIVSYRVRADRVAGLEKALAEIRKDPAVQFVEAAPPLEITPSWLSEASNTDLCSDNDAALPSINTALSATFLASLPVRRTTIAILDTGIVPNDTRFHLWRNPNETDETTDNDHNHLVGDLYGYDFVNVQSFPEDDSGEEKSFHGTHVAGIASQRVLTDDARAEIDKRIDLMILKVADKSGNVRLGSVSDAVSYATDFHVPIANMSFSGRFDYAVRKLMASAPSILFVVAAGNAHDHEPAVDVDQSDVYPARLAGELPNVLAVAACNRAFGAACFSNWGFTTVEVAAPGVMIKSTIAHGLTREASGTSQAAPYVSYVAALLASEGLSTPEAIKNRIVDTLDHYDALVGKVHGEGIVNAEKALTIGRDVVQLKHDRSLVSGRIVYPQQVVTSDGKTLLLSEVRKIVPHYSNDPLKAFHITTEIGGVRNGFPAALGIDHVTIDTGAEQRVIAIDDIIDIVPAYHGS